MYISKGSYEPWGRVYSPSYIKSANNEKRNVDTRTKKWPSIYVCGYWLTANKAQRNYDKDYNEYDVSKCGSISPAG